MTADVQRTTEALVDALTDLETALPCEFAHEEPGLVAAFAQTVRCLARLVALLDGDE